MAKKQAKKSQAKRGGKPKPQAPSRKDRAKATKNSGPWNYDDLARELQAAGLRIIEVAADGNCFFRALGNQLQGSAADHTQLRRQVVEYVRSHADDFAAFVEEDEEFDAYCCRMLKDGTWAGNIELQAASLLHGVNIAVHQAGQPLWRVQNFPAAGDGSGGGKAAAQTIHLSFHDGEHYNSVRLADDYGDGPAEKIADGRQAGRAAAAALDHGWGRVEEELVARGTGCGDAAAVADALKACDGSVEKAVERLIETLASGADASESAAEAAASVADMAAPADAGAAAAEQVPVGSCEDEQGEGREKRKQERKHPPRNRLCPCGSKQKYKNCCGFARRVAAAAAASSADAADVAAEVKQLLI